MKILTTRSQLRHTLESAHRIILEPALTIVPAPPGAPVITLLTPNSGTSAGGDTVIITGYNFTGATEVWFGVNFNGNVDAWSYTVNSDSQITATSPNGGGTVDVQVTTPSGTSAITPADRYTYVNAAVWWPEQVMDWDVQVAGATIYSAYTTGNTFWIGMNSLSAPTRQIDDGHWADLVALDPMGLNWGAAYYGNSYAYGIIGAIVQDANYIYWINDQILVVSRLAKSSSTFASLQTLVIPQGSYVDGTYANDNANYWGNENSRIGPDGKLYIAWYGAWNGVGGGSQSNYVAKLVVVDLAAWSPTGVSSYTYEPSPSMAGSGTGPQSIEVTANGTVIIAWGDGQTAGTAAYYYANISNLSSWTKVSASFAFRDWQSTFSGNLAFFCQATGIGTSHLTTKVAKIDVSSGFTETVIDLHVQDPNFTGHGQAAHCKTIWCSGTHLFAFGPRMNGNISATIHPYLGRFLLPNLTADGGKFWSQLVYNEYDQCAQAGYWDSGSNKCYMALEAFQEERNGFFICNEDLSSPQFYAPTPADTTSAPSNNAFANKVAVVTNAAAIRYDCTFSNQETNEPVTLMWYTVLNSDQNNILFNNTHSLWFTWTAPTTQTYNISAINSVAAGAGGAWPGYMMGVYTGSALGSLTFVTGSRGQPDGTPSIKNLNAISGTTYNFFVGFNTGNEFFGGAISWGEAHTSDYGKFDLQITGPVTDPHWGNVVLLCDFDGANGSQTSMLDLGPVSHGAACTVAQAHVSTEAIWTGNASGSFGRAPIVPGQAVSTVDGCWWPSSTDWQFGNQPFTIEMWIWQNSGSSSSTHIQHLVGQWGGATNLGWRFYLKGWGAAFDVTEDGTTVQTILDTGGSGALNNTWMWIGMDFDGITYRMYYGSNSTSAVVKNIFPSTQPLSVAIASDHNAINPTAFQWNIDGLRITKGIARFAGTVPPASVTGGPYYGDLTRSNIGKPFVGSVVPNAGTTGTSVIINGIALTGATAVKFGVTNASSFTVNSDIQITATAPAGSGTSDITVTTPAGTTTTHTRDQFVYTTADPQWAQVVLLMGFNDIDRSITAPGLNDESLSAHGTLSGSPAIGFACVSTEQALFGAPSPSSLKLAGNALGYADSADWALGSGQFTVEAFIFPTNLSASSGTQFIVCDFGASGPNLGWVLYMSSGKLSWNVSTTGSDNLNDLIDSVALTVNAWSHVCVDYDGTTYRLYVNGAVRATSTTARNIFHPVGTRLGLGANSAANAWWFYGYIEELRITKGTGRYHGAFTAPTSAFPRH